MMWSVFLCAYWPLVYLLWRNVLYLFEAFVVAVLQVELCRVYMFHVQASLGHAS